MRIWLAVVVGAMIVAGCLPNRRSHTAGLVPVQDSFARNFDDHRVLPAHSSIILASSVVTELVHALQGPLKYNLFYCAAGVPTDSGALVTKIWQVPLAKMTADTFIVGAMPGPHGTEGYLGDTVIVTHKELLCDTPDAIGGFAVLAVPMNLADTSKYIVVENALAMRRNFVFLAAVDRLVPIDGKQAPLIHWFVQEERAYQSRPMNPPKVL